MRPAVGCTIAALLGACASAQWANERGEVATREILSECSQKSMARASAEALYSGTYVSPQSNMGARTGRTEYPWNQSPPGSTGIQEQAYFNLCMREKGYALGPAAGGKR